jgi:hypothetical protein
MNGFAKDRLDAESFSDHRRRRFADREVEQTRREVFRLPITA